MGKYTQTNGFGCVHRPNQITLVPVYRLTILHSQEQFQFCGAHTSLCHRSLPTHLSNTPTHTPTTPGRGHQAHLDRRSSTHAHAM